MSAPEHKEIEVLALGGWNTHTNVLNIQYQAEIKILGVTFTSTAEQSMNNSWAIVTGKVKAQATETYRFDLCRSQRIQYVQTYLLAKIWHTAQVFPAPTTRTRQLSTAIAWYIWKGTTFSVTMSTLQRPKRQGGWGLLDIEAKCQALLLGRLWIQSTRGVRTAT